MLRTSFRSLWLPSLATLGFLAVTWPVWQWLWFEWMSNEYYSHGLLIPPVAAFLAFQRFRRDQGLADRTGQGSIYGIAVLGILLAIYLYYLQQRAYYLAAFAAIGMIAGLTWAIGGTKVIKQLAFPIGYLALMVPLPFVDRITLPLALFTGYCSGSIVQLLGMDITIVGNSISLPNADLIVGAQCSGVNSLITLLALLVLVAYLLDGSIGSRAALVLLAIPLALLGNIIRVATLLFVARSWGADAAFTYYHDYSGILFFAAVLLLIIPITRVLQFGQLRADVI